MMEYCLFIIFNFIICEEINNNNKQCSIVFNKTCLNYDLLPTYTLFSIYISYICFILSESAILRNRYLNQT